MTRQEIRGALTDADIASVKEAVGAHQPFHPHLRRIAERLGFEEPSAVAAEARRAALTALAAEAAREALHESAFGTRSALTSAEWARQAAGSADMDRLFRRSASAAPRDVSDLAHRLADGVVIAAALAAARETASEPSQRVLRRLRIREQVLETGERDALSRWDAALVDLLPSWASAARAYGRSRASARAAAVLAAARVRGEAARRAFGIGEDRLPLVFALASGYAALPVPTGVPLSDRSARFLGRVRHGRSLSAQIHDLSRQQDLSRLGAAALGAALGSATASVRRPATLEAAAVDSAAAAIDPEHAVIIIVDGILPIRLPWAALARLAPLTVPSAARRLELWAGDVRVDVVRREKYGRLAEALSRAERWRGDRVSFARLIGLPEAPTDEAQPINDARVHPAVPLGRRPPSVVCAGVRGGRIVCRAFADDEGRLVGYGAFDRLSREFRGRSQRAFYDLKGRRAGSLERDAGGWRTRLREPEKGFVSAPERIPL